MFCGTIDFSRDRKNEAGLKFSFESQVPKAQPMTHNSGHWLQPIYFKEASHQITAFKTVGRGISHQFQRLWPGGMPLWRCLPTLVSKVPLKLQAPSKRHPQPDCSLRNLWGDWIRNMFLSPCQFLRLKSGWVCLFEGAYNFRGILQSQQSLSWSCMHLKSSTHNQLESFVPLHQSLES